MYFFRTILASVFLVFFLTGVTYAASDSFRIKTFVGDDTIPPTVPANVTATPVAISQINLAWSTSTDNWALSGYQVFQHGPGTTTFTQIATTTGTTYSNVGLLASTTYSYYITAFDASGNISASSTVVATTTLASSTPPASTPSIGGSAPKIELKPIPIELVSLEIIPRQQSAVLRYVTEGFVRSIVRWGETPAYEQGSLQERSFRKVHQTEITGLSPGTRYHFTIEGENHLGRFGILTEATFTTLPSVDIFPPGNVQNLEAYTSGEDIILEWINPADDDFSHVRILRNDRFYPSDTADGWLVYEGDGKKAVDSGIAAQEKTQYYTVFTYDERGNVSSGAVVKVSFAGTGQATTTPTVEAPERISFSFSDIDFRQEGDVLENNGRSVSVDGTKWLEVALPYELMPEHLKAIILEINRTDGSGTDSFLLRINEDRTAYVTRLVPFTVEGRFPASMSVYDFETFEIGSTSGEVVSTISYISSVSEQDSGFLASLKSFFETNILLAISLLFLLLLLLLALLIARQYAHTND